MKIELTTIIFIFITIISFGQTSDEISSREFSLGLTFSPDYCYRALNSESSGQWIADIRDSTEIPKFGFTTGLSLLFKPWNRISFETGIQFSDKGEKTITIELIPLEPDPALPTTQVRINHHYYYLDIPIKVNYMVLKRKVKLFVSAGFSTNIYLYQQSKLSFVGSDVTNTSSGSGDLSRFNVAILIGGGIIYDISKRLIFRLEPIYRRSVTPIADAPIKQYQYSIGANFGLYYKLK